jgi:hypothetical protein
MLMSLGEYDVVRKLSENLCQQRTSPCQISRMAKPTMLRWRRPDHGDLNPLEDLIKAALQ